MLGVCSHLRDHRTEGTRMNDNRAVRILDNRTPEERERGFLPGMGKPWLLPFYDVFSRYSGVRPLHDRVAALAGVVSGESVLDVGCGTANLSLAVLRAQPAARVTGLDPDAAALRTASRKASRRRVPLTLVQGFADRLPTDDGSLDHIVSALALHHVPSDAQTRFGREAFRALRSGGKITIVDFDSSGGSDDAADADGGAHEAGTSGGHEHQHWYGRVRGRGRSGHGGSGHGGSGHGQSVAAADPRTAQQVEGGLVRLLADAGFTDAREVDHVEHRFGPLTFVQATRV